MSRSPSGDEGSPGTRIVIAGGGFGGAYVARHLEAPVPPPAGR